MNILFLETRQNEVWISMQEILPQIKRVWTLFCEEKGWDFHCVDVDNNSPTSYRKEILKADFIVVPAFNARVAQSLVVIRKMLGIRTPWLFYLHNQATIGLWPLYALGMGELLHKHDVFLGTCEGDRKAIDQTLKNYSYIPTLFSTEENINSLPPISNQGTKDILYIGRVSCQKNLHSLLMAFKRLKEKDGNLKLHLYGNEDQLGSPNMEWKADGYGAILHKLVHEEKIEDVNFYGFVNRQTIKESWKGKNFIFCSPSLHSDENFGMAALTALELGGRVVLTEWGGHLNFLKSFPKRVYGVPVYHHHEGPFIKVKELELALEKALNSQRNVEPQESFFNEKAIVKNLIEEFDKYIATERNDPLIAFGIVEKLLKKRKDYLERDANLLQKVFENYSDSDAQIFFEAYGAKYTTEKSSGELLPWVFKNEQGSFQVSDPIKKDLILSENEVSLKGYLY